MMVPVRQQALTAMLHVLGAWGRRVVGVEALFHYVCPLECVEWGLHRHDSEGQVPADSNALLGNATG